MKNLKTSWGDKIHSVGIWTWGCLHCTQFILLICKCKPNLIIQGDRKLHGLSEYVIGFKSICFYSDNRFEIQDKTIFFRGNIYAKRREDHQSREKHNRRERKRRSNMTI